MPKIIFFFTFNFLLFLVLILSHSTIIFHLNPILLFGLIFLHYMILFYAYSLTYLLTYFSYLIQSLLNNIFSLPFPHSKLIIFSSHSTLT